MSNIATKKTDIATLVTTLAVLAALVALAWSWGLQTSIDDEAVWVQEIRAKEQAGEINNALLLEHGPEALLD
jgi:hypothetical protein